MRLFENKDLIPVTLLVGYIFLIFIVLLLLPVGGCATVEESRKDMALRKFAEYGCTYNFDQRGFCCRDVVPEEELWIMNCEYGLCIEN